MVAHGMALLYFRLFLLAFSLLAPCIIASKETPRLQKDLDDDWWFHFQTRPDLQVPKYTVHLYDEEALAPGYWFVAPYANINKLKRGNGWEGPYIYNNHGELIWAGPPAMDYYMVNDFKISTVNDTDYITGIVSRDNGAFFLNNQYELVRTVNWTSAWEYANMHEFFVIDNGARALTITRDRWRNLTLEESRTIGFEGHCTVRADGIKEIDMTVEPARVLFEWVAIEHIPLIDSVKQQTPEIINEICQDNWDIHHVNSVDKFADGDYLVSIKEHDTLYKVSHIDGSIVWRLGRKHTDFRVPGTAKFGNQHTARIIEETETHLKLAIFANTSPKLSRGIVILVDYQDKSEAYTLPPNVTNPDLSSRGSTQLLPNGNMFTGWANWARVSEHDSDGKLLMYSHYNRDYLDRHGKKMATYRAYKFEWTGTPSYPPDVYSGAFAAGRNGTSFVTRIFVSWNGATEVARWNFYESNSDGTALKLLGDSKWHGFETGIWYDAQRYPEYVVVEALDREDESIGRSLVVKTLPPVSGTPLELNQGSVLNCDPYNSTDDAHNGFEASYDYDGFSYSTSWDSGDESAILSSFNNPISMFLAGFSTCLAGWMGTWVVQRWRKRLVQRRYGPKYQPVESKERELFFDGDDGDDGEEDEEGLEMKKRKAP